MRQGRKGHPRQMAWQAKEKEPISDCHSLKCAVHLLEKFKSEAIKAWTLSCDRRACIWTVSVSMTCIIAICVGSSVLECLIGIPKRSANLKNCSNCHWHRSDWRGPMKIKSSKMWDKRKPIEFYQGELDRGKECTRGNNAQDSEHPIGRQSSW